MNKMFEEDPKLIELANEVILERKLDYLNPVSIRYVLVDPYISKTVVGKCVRANAELRHFGECDYLIEFSRNIWESIDDVTRKIVMYHELLHILIKTGAKGNTIFSILDHDVKDFRSILTHFGVDWFTEVKDIVTSTNELEGAEVDSVTL